MALKPAELDLLTARRIWLRAQRLDTREPFGSGPDATRQAVEHLGYVQIDTINVIERSHHHILFSRIPSYRRVDLQQAQSVDKTVFEYWTHALAYIPVRDFRFFVPATPDEAQETALLTHLRDVAHARHGISLRHIEGCHSRLLKMV